MVELFVVAAAAVAIASVANAVRGSGSIEWTKNYFDTGAGLISVEGPLERLGPTEAVQPKHPYQEVTFDELVALLDDPNTAAGLNALIDARSDEHYESGHIPGAIQCDPYNIEPYIDDVLAQVMGAETVVIYCGGGDCEDSVFMCRELIEADVPYEAIYLYAGGWKEWTAKNMPVEEERE